MKPHNADHNRASREHLRLPSEPCPVPDSFLTPTYFLSILCFYTVDMLAPPIALSDSARALLQLPLLDVWRASELAVSRSTTCSTGHALLDEELPNKGWPRSSLIELLLQQAGIGEMQLLKPALARLSKNQRIALVHRK